MKSLKSISLAWLGISTSAITLFFFIPWVFSPMALEEKQRLEVSRDSIWEYHNYRSLHILKKRS